MPLEVQTEGAAVGERRHLALKVSAQGWLSCPKFAK
jgi:hypothetical protein